MVSQRSARASRRAGSVSTNGGNDVGMDDDVATTTSGRSPDVDLGGDDGRETNAPPTQPGSSYEPRSGDDHVKIMLATDNHIGYMERDPVRGQDSINTFREILQLAVEHDVDFILLGGDLFHENKPSRTTLHQVMGLLREYTLGDKPISIELLSDPSDGAAEGYTFPAVNYEDQNLNVAIPVFSIHGNHDDPQGVGVEGALSALDLLSVTGLVNYFGKVELPSSDALASRSSKAAPAAGGLSDDGIRIRPVLLQKGDTKIALYGMGNIKDERMHYELRANRVRMYRPREDPDDWFNILTIHQNRAAHDPKAMVPESMFDDSVHLVVWGHEHEQLIVPQPVAGKRYRISQPGSSVATSLCPGEAAEKQVAIIHVEKRDYMVEPITLKTVRPFIMDDIDLDDELEAAGLTIDDKQAVGKLLKTKIQDLIGRIDEEWDIKHAETPKEERPEKMLPLIRLRVQYTRHEMGNLVRFGQDFVGKVANPKDLLQFSKKKTTTKKKDKSQKGEDFVEPTEDMVPSERLERVKMSDLVQDYLGSQRLQILNPHGLERAIMNFVDKDDKEAIGHFVEKVMRSTRKGLVEIGPDERQLDSELDKIREEQQRAARPAANEGGEEDGKEDGRRSKGRKNGKSTVARGAGVDSDDSMLDDALADGDVDGIGLSEEDDDEDDDPRARRAQASTSRRGGGGAKAAPPARGKGRGGSTTTSKQTFLGQNDDDDEEEEDEDEVPPPKSSRAAALGSNAESKKRAPAKTSTRKTAPLPKASSTTRGRAAAKNARSKLVESQAVEDDEEEEDEIQSYAISDDDDFEVPPTRQTQTQTRKRPIGRNQF